MKHLACVEVACCSASAAVSDATCCAVESRSRFMKPRLTTPVTADTWGHIVCGRVWWTWGRWESGGTRRRLGGRSSVRERAEWLAVSAPH